MAAPKRTPFERERDLERTAELYLKRKTQEEIAGLLGVDQSMISRDIALIKKRWRESGTINMDEAQKEKLSELALLKREHYQAWENSYGEHVKTRTEQSTTGKGKEKGGAKAIVEKETLLGNPAYLNGILNAIQEECKILGLYAPTKIAPTSPDGKEQYESATDVLISRIAGVNARIGAPATTSGDSAE